MTVEIRCPISVTMLRNEASSLQRWAATLPPTKAVNSKPLRCLRGTTCDVPLP
jgi:hypothetical protein